MGHTSGSYGEYIASLPIGAHSPDTYGEYLAALRLLSIEIRADEARKVAASLDVGRAYRAAVRSAAEARASLSARSARSSASRSARAAVPAYSRKTWMSHDGWTYRLVENGLTSTPPASYKNKAILPW